MRIRGPAIVTGLACALALVAAGCGGGGGDTKSTDTQPQNSKKEGKDAKKAPTTVAGRREAAAGTVKSLCQTKQKSGTPMSKADRAKLRRAVLAYAAAYKKRPGATQSGGAKVRDSVINLSSGLLNQCREPVAARSLVVAVATAKGPKPAGKPGDEVESGSGVISDLCKRKKLSKADKDHLRSAVHHVAGTYKRDRKKPSADAEQQVLLVTAAKLLTTCHEPASAATLLDAARPT